jgi:cell division protein FtsL
MAACSRTEIQMEPFEYAIKKDVRNNPIVREVDEARQRELWKSAGLAGFLVIVVLFSAWQHFEMLRHGYQIEEMSRERSAQEEVGRQLRLEIDTLKSPKRIEALAIGRLHLVAPSGDEAVIIERVQPADPPAKSMVAGRQ